ncbi:MAG: diphosphomevalonate decarboxylase, partial [Bacteriovorax sp.]
MNLESVYHIKWSSPSNIALVKYWGKHGVQLPQNPSISFTLKNSLTNLSLEIFKSEAPGLSFSFHGQANAKFEEKIAKFLSTKRDRFPWLENHFLKMDSTNTFPHSSGIASSASSMSALALCLLSADEFFTGKKYRTEDFLKEASELARLASGSASRSVYPGMAIWGELKEFPHGSNDYATPFTEAHPIF